MVDRCESMLDMQLDVEFPKCLVVKLPVVIDDDGVLESELTNDQSPEKGLDLGFGDMC